MLGGIASRRDTTALGTPYMVPVRGTQHEVRRARPRDGARRAFVGAAPGLGTRVLRTEYFSGSSMRRNLLPFLDCLLDHALSRLARHLLVAAELATESRASVRHGLERAGVEMQLRLRDDRADASAFHVGRHGLGAEDLRAARREIAEHVAEAVVGDDDVHFVQRLEHDGSRLRRHRPEGEDSRHLELHLAGVHGVVRAVEQLHLEVDERVAREDAAFGRFMDSLLDRGNELARDRAADDPVFELDAVAARNGRDAHPAIAELSASARLLLVASLPFGARADRLTIGDARSAQLGDDPELALQLRQRDLEMAL